MDEINILLAIAEIGAVFAGFGSLATVVGQSHQNADPAVSSLRLRALLDISLTAMMLSLIAVLIFKIDIASTWAWRWSSIVSFFFLAPVCIAAHKRSTPLRNSLSYNQPGALAIYLILGTVLVGFAINSTGMTGSFGFEVYLGALILMLAASAIYFVIFVISLLNPGSNPLSNKER